MGEGGSRRHCKISKNGMQKHMLYGSFGALHDERFFKVITNLNIFSSS